MNSPEISDRHDIPRRRWNLLALFSRTTSSGSFIPEIDGLRCLAIAGVIAFHLAGYVTEKTPTPFVPSAFDSHFYQLLRTGHIGVELFFVLSGFVVALPFAMHHLADGKPVNLRRYFVRRLTRIEPPYAIALVFWLLAFGISGLGEAPFRVLLAHFPASLFYVHHLVYGHPSIVLPSAWSLEIEIQFYLLAPLLVLVFRIHRVVVRRMILVSAIAVLAFLQPWLRLPNLINGFNLLQEGHYFLIGLLLVDLHVVHWRQGDASAPRLGDVLATICFIAVLPILIYQVGGQLLITFLLAMFVGSVLRSRYWRAMLRSPVVYTFGGMCYTTYLYHGFFKALPGHFTIRWQIGHAFWLNFLIQSVMLVPIIIVGSAVMFLITEKPFMRRSRSS